MRDISRYVPAEWIGASKTDARRHEADIVAGPLRREAAFPPLDDAQWSTTAYSASFAQPYRIGCSDPFDLLYQPAMP